MTAVIYMKSARLCRIHNRAIYRMAHLLSSTGQSEEETVVLRLFSTEWTADNSNEEWCSIRGSYMHLMPLMIQDQSMVSRGQDGQLYRPTYVGLNMKWYRPLFSRSNSKSLVSDGLTFINELLITVQHQSANWLYSIVTHMYLHVYMQAHTLDSRSTGLYTVAYTLEASAAAVPVADFSQSLAWQWMYTIYSGLLH
jgi:hypothetical protein